MLAIFEELLNDMGDPAQEDPEAIATLWEEAEALVQEEEGPKKQGTCPRDMFDFLEELGMILRAKELLLGEQDALAAQGTKDTYDWLDAEERSNPHV